MGRLSVDTLWANEVVQKQFKVNVWAAYVTKVAHRLKGPITQNTFSKLSKRRPQGAFFSRLSLF